MMIDSRTKTKQICIFHLNPNNFTPNVWGGSWLPTWKKVKQKKEFPIGESWDFSLHSHLPSQILLKGKKWGPVPQLLKKSSFLLKMIDARDNLSLQVHPNDVYAKKHEKDFGKAESWVILSSSLRSSGGYIYLGFRKNLTGRYKNSQVLKKDFLAALQQKKSAASLLQFLNKIKVKPGDVFYLPPGTVHAIGAGVRLFEIQQTSNVTYRVWDWNRVPPRPLHLKQALDVIEFKPRPVKSFRQKPVFIKTSGEGTFSMQQILMDDQQRFTVHQINLLKKGSLVNQSTAGKFCVLSVMKGRVEIPGWGFIEEGHSALVMAESSDYQLKAVRSSTRIFKSFVP